MLFTGKNIGKGRLLDYFERTDPALTIIGLLGKEWLSKNGSEGRFVKEVLEHVSVKDYHPEERIKKLNEQIRTYSFLRVGLIPASGNDGYFANTVALLENESVIEPFYHQDRILDGHKAGTTDHLIESNEKVLDCMREILSRQNINE